MLEVVTVLRLCVERGFLVWSVCMWLPGTARSILCICSHPSLGMWIFRLVARACRFEREVYRFRLAALLHHRGDGVRLPSELLRQEL